MMSPEDWRSFLSHYSRDLIGCPDIAEDLPPEVLDSAWLAYPPASEAEITAAEARLGGRLPPSLRAFYSVTDGWRTTGFFIWNVLPVQGLGWLRDREPSLL